MTEPSVQEPYVVYSSKQQKATNIAPLGIDPVPLATLQSGRYSPSTLPARSCSKARKKHATFLMFILVLMKYLTLKDPSLHSRAKDFISDWCCVETNKEASVCPNNMYLNASLNELVGDRYWKKAYEILNQYMKQKHATTVRV